MTRGGARDDVDEPERKCIVSGESQPKGGLIRFVVGPEGVVVPDVTGKLPGRGMYVAADREAIENPCDVLRNRIFAGETVMTMQFGIENALDQRYQEIYGYQTARIAAYAGVKLTFDDILLVPNAANNAEVADRKSVV